MSDKSEASFAEADLCVGCQVLREIANPTTSPDLQEIRYLHPGLLGLSFSITQPQRLNLEGWIETL
jgi:hypothetical protein